MPLLRIRVCACAKRGMLVVTCCAGIAACLDWVLWKRGASRGMAGCVVYCADPQMIEPGDGKTRMQVCLRMRRQNVLLMQ